MNAVAVDTSVLLAIFKDEARGELWLETLQSSAEAASLILSSIVLAEIRSFFPSDEACRKAVRDLDLKHSALNPDASLLAGKIFRSYRTKGWARTTILPDFLVGHMRQLKQTTSPLKIEGTCARIFRRSVCCHSRERNDFGFRGYEVGAGEGGLRPARTC